MNRTWKHGILKKSGESNYEHPMSERSEIRVLWHKNKKNTIYTEAFSSDGAIAVKNHLDYYLSPLIQDYYDMQYNGTCTWYGPWEQHMRKVISVFWLKGDQGILEWGYNFDFLPEFKSNRFQYFRTEKQIKAQFRDMPKPFVDLEFGDHWQKYLIPMHGNSVHQLERRIQTVWKQTSPDIQNFFESIHSLEAILGELNDRIEQQKARETLNYYSMLLPESYYIKAFILAYMGEDTQAVDCMKHTNVFQHATEEHKQKMIQKLKELQHDTGLRPTHD